MVRILFVSCRCYPPAGQETCAGNDVVGFGRSLRDALLIRYRFRLRAVRRRRGARVNTL